MPKRSKHRKRRPLPRSLQAWLEEIVEAIADANAAKPFGEILGKPIKDADLFLLAPLVCLKFRGREREGPEAEQVKEAALATYVAISGDKGFGPGLKQKPKHAFAVCYVAAHLVLDLLDEEDADTILGTARNI